MYELLLCDNKLGILGNLTLGPVFQLSIRDKMLVSHPVK